MGIMASTRKRYRKADGFVDKILPRDFALILRGLYDLSSADGGGMDDGPDQDPMVPSSRVIVVPSLLRFDAVGEHTGSGHDRNLVVPFGGEPPGSGGPDCAGKCHLNTATLYLRTCRRLLSACTSVADPVAWHCTVVICLLIQTLWHSSFVDNIFAEDFVCLLVIDSCINPLVIAYE
ncbi:hypothetical protein M5K25_016471 [Dendrobium thyrsiflorum]|uniref:Uncharacterized protein n=1 Tax=Dendrobium thyrsiflorum TaxID=117978 RepID=A0ABD0UKM7_DENTH